MRPSFSSRIGISFPSLLFFALIAIFLFFVVARWQGLFLPASVLQGIEDVQINGMLVRLASPEHGEIVEIPPGRRTIVTCPDEDPPEELEGGWIGPVDLPQADGLRVYEYEEDPYASTETDKTMWGRRRWSGDHYGFGMESTLTQFRAGRRYYVRAEEIVHFRCSGPEGEVSSSSSSPDESIPSSACTPPPAAGAWCPPDGNCCPQGRECCAAGGILTCRNPDGSSACPGAPSSSPPGSQFPGGNPTEGLVFHWSFDAPEYDWSPDLNDYSGYHLHGAGFTGVRTGDDIHANIPQNVHSLECHEPTGRSIVQSRAVGTENIPWDPSNPEEHLDLMLNPPPISFSIDSRFSVALWVKVSDSRKAGMFAFHNGKRGFELDTNDETGHIEMRIFDVPQIVLTPEEKFIYRSHATIPTDGQWHSVIMTYNGEFPLAQRVRIFLDGQATAITTHFPDLLLPPVSLMPLLPGIGFTVCDTNHTHSSYNQLDGFIDDVRVYNRLVTPADIPGL